MWSEMKSYLDSDKITPEKGILKADYVSGYLIEIWFEEDHDVSIYSLDMKPILEAPDTGEALQPLLNLDRFRQVVGQYRLLWNDPDTGEYNENAIDISPEAMRWLCQKYGNIIK